MNPLDNVVVVLDHPQNLVNIAAIIRGMKNMGLSRLRCVNPAEWNEWRIEGIAHRSQDVVSRTEMFESLDDALSDCVWVVGTSARSRTANRNYTRPSGVAPELAQRARSGPVAIVFGREDRGLDNDALDRCDQIAVIPTDPDYSSLNLAQAFLILAYEIYQAAEEETIEAPDSLPKGRRVTEPATRDDMEKTFAALLGALTRIRFFKGARLPEAVMRTIRTVLSRADLDQREARLFAAIGFETHHYITRELGDDGTPVMIEDPSAEEEKDAGV